jgi:16S rRNA (guanine527-N7)-methyltransferase
MKGARVDEEIEKARKVILRKRLSDVEVLELGEGVVDETTRVFRATVD